MSTEMAYGSLADVAQKSGKAVAETFLSVDCLVMMDTSASMSDCDAGESGMESRHSIACTELQKIQRQMPGKIGVIEWNSFPAFCPGGVPGYPRMATDLAACLEFIKPADNTGIELILISDGEPDNEIAALDCASAFKSKIDTVYVGPKNGPGADFLKRLAALTGGQSVTQSVSEIAQLSTTVKGLLK